VKKMPYIDAITPQGAFYLFIDCSELLGMEYNGMKFEDTSKIAEVLLNDYMVAVVPCIDFGAKDHIRLSYATSIDEITKGLDRIERFVHSFR
jgi:aspartate aminotransferase